MRLAFAGTPEFSVGALDALHAAGHDIAGVFTQPDRPAGRGQKLTASPVARRAEALGLPVHKPLKFREDAQDALRAMNVSVFVVVAYGLILPQAALDIPARGCFNIHASLLPRWRGAAPIQRAILAGDQQTGVTIMRMEAGLDTGPMLLAEALPIHDDTTAASLHDALATLGARLIVQALAQLERGDLQEQAQPADGVTYAAKIDKDEARLDWTLPARELARRVRGYDPVPVAWSTLDGERIRIHAAHASEGRGEPGTILGADAQGIRVACSSGALALTRAQWPGARAMSAAELISGKRDLEGRRFV